MKKYFKILLNVIFINLLFINSINSKTLPPGTGGAADVPANVLILLDVSGSMGWDIQEGLNYGNDVQAVAPITNSGSVLTYTRNTLRQTNQAGNAQENINPNRRELTHQNNFGLGDNRKKVVFYENQIFTYDNSQDRLYRYEYANNNIQSVERMRRQNFSQMFLSGDNLILMNHDGASYRVKDLTALNVNATQCNTARNSTLNRIHSLNSFAQNPTFTFNVDASGNLIAFGQERNNLPVRLYKFASAGTCFNNEPSETHEINNNNNFNQPSSIVGHPTNENVFFVTDAGRHSLQRITVANSTIMIDETVGSFGGINANYNPTNANNIRFNQPAHIAVSNNIADLFRYSCE